MEGTEAPETLSFDKEGIEALIRESVKNSFTELKESEQGSRQQREVQQTQQAPQQDQDPWAAIIDPYVNRATSKASLIAAAAEDKADFYSSEEWTTELDELLPGDNPQEIAKAKREIRASLEKTFSDMLNSGRGTFRRELLNYEVGKYIKVNKDKVEEHFGKRSSAKKESELAKARKQVDIQGATLSNYTPQQLFSMKHEEIVEKFGELTF